MSKVNTGPVKTKNQRLAKKKGGKLGVSHDRLAFHAGAVEGRTASREDARREERNEEC